MQSSIAFLLLTVALLAPLRVALAAGGLVCHMPAFGSAAGPHAAEPMHRHAEQAASTRLGVAHEHGDDAARTDHLSALATDASSPQSCDACVSLCGAPTMPPRVASASPPPVAASERFPSFHPPRALAAWPGPERPPRTI